MIRLWMASPKKFEKFDFKKIGTGTGIARHGEGMYLGNENVARDYLKDYQGYTSADRTYFYRGNELSGDAEAVAAFLQDHGRDISLAETHFSDNPEAIKVLGSKRFAQGFQVSYGQLSEVRIPNFELSDFNHWDEEIPEDLLNDIAVKFLEKTIDWGRLDKGAFLGMELDLDEYYRDVEGIIDDLFDLAFEDGLEEETLELSADEDKLREAWYKRVRKDDYSFHDHEGELVNGVRKGYFDLLDQVCENGLQLEAGGALTYGDLYSQIEHALSQLKEKDLVFTAASLMTAVGVPALRANAIRGDVGSEELVVYDQDIASTAKIRPVNDYEEPGLEP